MHNTKTTAKTQTEPNLVPRVLSFASSGTRLKPRTQTSWCGVQSSVLINRWQRIKRQNLGRSYHHNCTSFWPEERQSWKSSYRGGPEHSFGALLFSFLMSERRRSICNAWYWNNRTACSKNRRLATFVWERRAPNLENKEKKRKKWLIYRRKLRHLSLHKRIKAICFFKQ